MIVKFNRYKLIGILFFLGLMNYTLVGAQNAVIITIDEAIQYALANNRDIQIAGFEEQIAKSQHSQTDAIWLPQVNASYTAMSSNNPLYAFGFKLQQQGVEMADFNPEVLNYPNETQNYMAMIEVRQPLLNIDNIYQRKAVSKQSEIAGYKSQRTKEYVTFQVKKSYMQLQFAYNAVTVVADALERAQVVYEFVNNRYEKGLLPKSDLLNAQLQVKTLETKLSEAQSGVQNASDMLGLAMGRISQEVYQVVENSSTREDNLIIPDSVPDLRADMLAMRSAIEATSLMRQSKITSLMPRINAFASYQLNDKEITGFGSDSHYIGVQLAWTLFDGSQSYHQISEQKKRHSMLNIQFEKQKLESETELQRTKRGVRDSQLKLIQHQVSLTQADESLRIVQNRHEQGLANTSDLLMAQSQLAMLDLSLQQVKLELSIGNAYGEFLTSVTK